MTDIVTRPVSTAIDAEADAKLVRQLTSSSRLDIRVRWDRDEEDKPFMVLVVLPAADADIESALAHVHASCAPPSPDKIAEGLAVLGAVCLKPSDFSDAKIILWTRRLMSVLQQYPADVVMETLNEWPKGGAGRFWPTEHDLHALCSAKAEFRHRLRSHLETMRRVKETPQIAAPSDGFSDCPTPEAEAFMAAFRAVDGDRAESYFTGARFNANRIGCKLKMAPEVIERLAPGLMAQHGVKVVTALAYHPDGTPEWGE